MTPALPRILCYGGSFNPIHHGHLICAQAAAEALGFDRVYLIPSAQPPHREHDSDMASAHDRLTMCQLAVANTPLFQVDDVELRRDKASYTLETARILKHERQVEVAWLIGGDTLPRLPTWYDFPNLLKEVQFVVMERPGWQIDWDKVDISFQPLRQNVVAAPLIDISATDIRGRARLGKSIDFLTPLAVAAYIDSNELYR